MAQPASDAPRWRRRKSARPAEIAAAALEVFAEKGFAAARLEDIAARAGVSKAALYRYFETKADLFRAVVAATAAPEIARIRPLAEAYDGPLSDILPMLLARFAAGAQRSSLGSVAKMVIGESRNFPELARVWHDEVASQGLGILAGLIARAQARGEVREGDPRIHAASVLGPLVVGLLWRETFGPVGAAPLPLDQIATQHARTVLDGLKVKDRPA